MSLGPFDLTGSPFLELYAALLALAIVASLLIPASLRPGGDRREITSAEEIAFLAGGPARHADAVVVAMLSSKKLAMTGADAFMPDKRATAGNPAEAAVLSLRGPADWSAIARALGSRGRAIKDALVAGGLLMREEEARRTQFWQTAPYLLLFGFGAVKWAVGSMRDRPVGYLTMFLIFTLFLAVLRWKSLDRRTRGGSDSLTEAQGRLARLKRAPTRSEAGLAVAMFGTAVLVGSDISTFHTRRSSGSGDSGGGGCGSDGGGSGGGCGGCGGH